MLVGSEWEELRSQTIMKLVEKKENIKISENLDYYAIKTARNIFINNLKKSKELQGVDDLEYLISDIESEERELYLKAKRIIEKDLLSDKRMYNAMVFMGVIEYGTIDKYAAAVKIPYIEIYNANKEYKTYLKNKIL